MTSLTPAMDKMKDFVASLPEEKSQGERIARNVQAALSLGVAQAADMGIGAEELATMYLNVAANILASASLSLSNNNRESAQKWLALISAEGQARLANAPVEVIATINHKEALQ